MPLILQTLPPPDLSPIFNLMPERRRTNVVKRLTGAGWSQHEAVALLLGSVVLDLRDTLRGATLPADEQEEAQQFHREARTLWEAALSIDPVLDRKELVMRLTALVGACPEGFEPYRRRLERAVKKARALVSE